VRAVWALAVVVVGCAAPAPIGTPAPAPIGTPAPAPATIAPPAAPDPRITVETAAHLLDTPIDPICPIDCMIDRAYAGDRKAATLAHQLYAATGDVAGVGDATDMDGGFRGPIHLVPEWPTGGYRKHLAWVVAALVDYDDFFAQLDAPVSFRWRDLEVRFVRSVKKHTPSAFALRWNVSYNVEGSLLVSADRVRETLFHEIFHMNDDDRGDWSGTALRADYDAIIARCGTTREATACLAPYAPSETKVRGGTFYAFTQDNGDPVHEYAAELALRYYREQREMLRQHRLSRPAFKCGPPENRRSWDALVTEFFAGRDLVPRCR
jgi:hypothetical protein